VIVGLATDYCVKETALDARRLGFAACVVRDGVAAVDLEEGDGEGALEAMHEAGVELV
jgi:nicotinamidase/pyrazinamidase